MVHPIVREKEKQLDKSQIIGSDFYTKRMVDGHSHPAKACLSPLSVVSEKRRALVWKSSGYGPPFAVADARRVTRFCADAALLLKICWGCPSNFVVAIEAEVGNRDDVIGTVPCTRGRGISLPIPRREESIHGENSISILTVLTYTGKGALYLPFPQFGVQDR